MSYLARSGTEILTVAETGSPLHSGKLGDISLAALNDGGFAMSWDYRGDFWVEHISSTGFENGSGYTEYYTLYWPTDSYVGFKTFSSSGTAADTIQINRYDSEEWGDPGVSDDVPTRQLNSSVTALADGRYVIALADEGVQDAGQVRVGGLKVWFGAIDSATPALTYRDQAPADADYLTANTMGADLTIENVGAYQERFQPDVVELTNGTVLIAWTEFPIGYEDSPVAMGQIYQADASSDAEVGSAFEIGSGVQTAGTGIKLAALAGGRFVATWTTIGGDVQAGIYEASGQRTAIVDVHAPDPAVVQSEPDVAKLRDGGFILTWTVGAGDASIIAGQVFAADGAKVGSPFNVGDADQSVQHAQVTATADGGFVVGWDAQAGVQGSSYSPAGVRLQFFDAFGQEITGPLEVSETGSDLALTTLANGDLVASWVEETGIAGGVIHTQIFDVNGAIRGDQNADKSDDLGPEDGPAGDGLGGVVIYGLTGNDTIRGSADEDRLRGGTDSDTVSGLDGDDHIFGEDGSDALFGGAGADELDGGDGNDALDGGTGDDILRGGAGDDVLDGGTGETGTVRTVADTFDGGTGHDLASYASAATGVTTNLGLGTILAGASNEANYDLYIDIEGIIGSNHGDRIFGGAADDEFRGLDGGDQLDGGGGNDLLAGGRGIDTLVGGLGNDIFDGGEGADTFIGGRNLGDTTGGDDTATYASSAGGVFAALDSTLTDAAGNYPEDFFFFIDNLTGSRFNDHLAGDGAANKLLGGLGADMLDGGGGADTLDGGAGSDVMLVSSGDVAAGESYNGGADFDTLRTDAAALDLTGVTLTGIESITTTQAYGTAFKVGSAETALLVHGSASHADTLTVATGTVAEAARTQIFAQGIEVITDATGVYRFDDAPPVVVVPPPPPTVVTPTDPAGTPPPTNPIATGTPGNDTLTGTTGDDRMSGGLGVDTLVGGAGNDRLSGGVGRDTLTGGTGPGSMDTFVFDASLKKNVDTITDFERAYDQIVLDDAYFKGLGKGSPDGTPIKKSMFAANKDGEATSDGTAQIVYETDTGKLFYDADGEGGKKAVQFAILENAPKLTFKDFEII